MSEAASRTEALAGDGGTAASETKLSTATEDRNFVSEKSGKPAKALGFSFAWRRMLKRLGVTFTLAALSLAVASITNAAPVFQTLHSFGQAGPTASLIQASDGNLYGTTGGGGINTNGMVFGITPGGTITMLYSFTGGSDGANPFGGLVQATDGKLYGTTLSGGAGDAGTVFQITTNGTLLTVYSFTGGNDGANPYAGLTQASDGNFYGTTVSGGASGVGTVFRVTPNGTFASLHSFAGLDDGASPYGGLVQASDGNLYGTTLNGGASNNGSIFQLSTNGPLTTIHSFTANDGSQPYATLVQASDGSLYGTTSAGGDHGRGTVFQITTNGDFALIYSFTGGNDGYYPYAGLVEGSDGNLYGTTLEDASYGYDGTVFQVTTSGALSTLYSFAGLSDGDQPYGGLVQGSDGNLYGTTYDGGDNDGGTVFGIIPGGSLTTLYSFGSGYDGAMAFGHLMQANDGSLYGTTLDGGASDNGTVFRISTNGTFRLLYSFTGLDDGAGPYAGLMQASDGNLYGTTFYSGISNNGTVFRITPDGTMTTLSGFTGRQDGYAPFSTLVQASDGNLYGTTEDGGRNGGGTVFRLTLSGTLTTLYSFGVNDGGFHSRLLQTTDGSLYGTIYNGGASNSGSIFRVTLGGTFTRVYSFTGERTNARYPYAGLIQASDGNLYGTTYFGGTNDMGTVFRFTTNGVFTVLYSFSGPNDGIYPYAGLVQASDGMLYGTTFGDIYLGSNGTVFQIATNGTFRLLYSFTGLNDGAEPKGLVQASDGNLYGTTSSGGALSGGTVFRILLAPRAVPPVFIHSPLLSGGNFSFSFQTLPSQSYTIQQNTNLAMNNWSNYTNFTGDGSLFQLSVPVNNAPSRFFRVREP